MSKDVHQSSTTGKHSLAVVKTSDLIYVFCAAAWVNVLTSNFNDGANWLCYILAFLTFALIPLELYTGSLWQQAVALVDNDPKDDALQQSILAALDIFRLFSLSMSFVLLYIPLDTFKKSLTEVKGQASLEAYLIFIAIFLSSNWIWNQVLFRGWFSRPSSAQIDNYQALLDKHNAVTTTDNSSLDEFRDHPKFEYIKKMINFGRDFTNSFGNINRFIFEKIFILISLLLYTIAAAGLFWPDVHNYILSIVGYLSLFIFTLQFGAKIIQIIYFSNAVSDIREADSPVPAIPPGVVS